MSDIRVLFLTNWYVGDAGAQDPGLFVPYDAAKHGRYIKFLYLEEYRGGLLLVAPVEHRQCHKALLEIYLQWRLGQLLGPGAEDLFDDELRWLEHARLNQPFEGGERRILAAGELNRTAEGHWVVDRWNAYSLPNLVTPKVLDGPIIQALQIEDQVEAAQKVVRVHALRIRKRDAIRGLVRDRRYLRALLTWVGLLTFE